MIGTVAILGMPPFGVFASEFLILTTAMKDQPWATPLLLLALAVAFAAIVGRVQPMVFGESSLKTTPTFTRAVAGIRAPGAGVGSGNVHTTLPRAMVPRCGAVDRRAVRMPWRDGLQRGSALAGAPGARLLVVGMAEWRQVALDVATSRGRLLTLWSGVDHRGAVVRAAYALEGALLVAELSLAKPEEPYPGLEDLFPAADRMQRASADLTGIRSSEHGTRPWLRHASWPESFLPLRGTVAPLQPDSTAVDDYAFVHVAGDGVHELPVGPVHAGIIEPGHFRFSVVGEKVLRLEERLGYAHKGIERLFTQLDVLQGQRLAARVSGDSAVAFSWAYCQAVEGIAGTEIPRHAAWLRALCLELERIANHLGDLGALGNDAGFAFGLAQFSRLKEGLLRATEAALGQRYLMDIMVPGGVRRDLEPAGAGTSAASCRVCWRRFCCYVTSTMSTRAFAIASSARGALHLNLPRGSDSSVSGRASGQAFDWRVDLPCAPYDEFDTGQVRQRRG